MSFEYNKQQRRQQYKSSCNSFLVFFIMFPLIFVFTMAGCLSSFYDDLLLFNLSSIQYPLQVITSHWIRNPFTRQTTTVNHCEKILFRGKVYSRRAPLPSASHYSFDDFSSELVDCIGRHSLAYLIFMTFANHVV